MAKTKRMTTLANLYSKKYETIPLVDGLWRDILGEKIQANGIWIIYGKEKNGKTSFALQTADFLTTMYKVLYVSGEEGDELTFTEACKRAGLSAKNNRFKPVDMISIDEISQILRRRNSPKVVFIDNVTVYREALQYGVLERFIHEFRRNKILIFLAHEENGEPLGHIARKIKILSMVIARVDCLIAEIWGRANLPGGKILIDETNAKLSKHVEDEKVQG